MKTDWSLWRALPQALPYLKPYWKLATVSGVLLVLAAAASLAAPWPLAAMLDAITGYKSKTSWLFFGETDRYTYSPSPPWLASW